MTQAVIVAAADDGQRLDRWIKKHFPDVPFGQVQKILRTGQLRIDGKRVKGDARLATGQSVRIPPQMQSPAPKTERAFAQKDADAIRAMVIYQDEHVIALNKPAGLAVQGGTKIRKHIDGMLNGLEKDGLRPHLVHRLDKDTSGVLLLACNPQAARALGAAFSGRDIRKYYWAVTAPAPQIDNGKIKSALAKVDAGGGERMMVVDDENADGKMSLTYYAVMERLGQKLAWVAFWPKTGRQHQIRVHAAQIGCPLLGDFKYDSAQSFLQENAELPQTLHLHARRIIMRHPVTGRKLDITAPLGGAMKKTFKYFGFNADDRGDPFADLD